MELEWLLQFFSKRHTWYMVQFTLCYRASPRAAELTVPAVFVPASSNLPQPPLIDKIYPAKAAGCRTPVLSLCGP